jgi:3-phenylpropionate/trans-cinnamate dioxygenase ferredoxin subunit
MDGEQDFVRVGTLAEIPDGEMRAYDFPGARVSVANLSGEARAFADECPHAGCSLAEGELTDDGTVVCAQDGSEFDLETGEPVRGPAVDPIAILPARTDDGWVEVAFG